MVKRNALTFIWYDGCSDRRECLQRFAGTHEPKYSATSTAHHQNIRREHQKWQVFSCFIHSVAWIFAFLLFFIKWLVTMEVVATTKSTNQRYGSARLQQIFRWYSISIISFHLIRKNFEIRWFPSTIDGSIKSINSTGACHFAIRWEFSIQTILDGVMWCTLCISCFFMIKSNESIFIDHTVRFVLHFFFFIVAPFPRSLACASFYSHRYSYQCLFLVLDLLVVDYRPISIRPCICIHDANVSECRGYEHVSANSMTMRAYGIVSVPLYYNHHILRRCFPSFSLTDCHYFASKMVTSESLHHVLCVTFIIIIIIFCVCACRFCITQL